MDATTWTMLVVGWIVQLAVTVGAVLWVRKTPVADALRMAELRRDVRQGLGAAAQAWGHATATFDKQAVSLIREVRAAAGQLPSPPVPPPPPSGAQASDASVDSGESEDERCTMEMAVWDDDARPSDVDARTVVRSAPTATPIGQATRAKLVRLRNGEREPVKGAG